VSLNDVPGLANSGQIALRQRRSHPGCQNFAFCLVVMLKAVDFFEGRNAYNLTRFKADHARLDDLFGLESRPACSALMGYGSVVVGSSLTGTCSRRRP
jgi:hypothetical protein